VTIPEEKGSFLKFCQLLGGRSVTEFNYRFADAKDACIFVGVRLSRGLEERKEILNLLHEGGYSVVDLSDDEMAKLHVRYMVGGRPSKPLQERLFSFEFPESPGRCSSSCIRWAPTGTSPVPLPQPRHRLWSRAGGVRTGRARAGFRNAAE
jgi:hypothetical protein